MARAYKCDRCGVYYHELKDANGIEILGKWDPTNDYKKYDICNRCREDFMVFMSSPDYGKPCNDYCCEP